MAGCTSATIVLSNANKKRLIKNEITNRTHCWLKICKMEIRTFHPVGRWLISVFSFLFSPSPSSNLLGIGLSSSFSSSKRSSVLRAGLSLSTGETSPGSRRLSTFSWTATSPDFVLEVRGGMLEANFGRTCSETLCLYICTNRLISYHISIDENSSVALTSG